MNTKTTNRKMNMRRVVSLVLYAMYLIVVFGMNPASAGTIQSESTESIRIAIDDLVAEGKIRCSTLVETQVDTAVMLFDSAMNLKASLGESDDTLVASLHWWIGFCHGLNNRHAMMEERMNRALEIWRRLLGQDHPETGRALRVLAWARHKASNATWETEQLVEDGLRLYENHPGYDLTTQGLWHLLLSDIRLFQGRNAETLASIKRALALFEHEHGEISFYPAMAYGLMSNPYVRMGMIDSAIASQRRSVELFEQCVGPDHPYLATNYGGLGDLMMAVEKYDSASYFLEKALAIKLRSRPPNHPDLIDSYFDLARLAYIQGQYRKAVDYMEKTLEIRRSNSGRNWWPDRGMELSRLARYFFSAGETERALSTFKTVVDERIAFLEKVFPFIPEYLKLWYARVNSPLDEGLLTMALMESDPDITEMAFETAMTGKGIVIDALMAERTISYCVEDQNLPDMVQRHGQVCTEIAEQTLQKLQPNSTGIVPENLTGLYRIKDSLETAISQRCSEYESRLASSKTTVEQVTSAIPEGAVLWDIVAFSPWNFQPTNHRNSYHPRKYIGFVVSAGNLIQIVELGDAALIDSLIAEIRVNLANASTTISVQGEQTAEDTLSVLTAQLYSTIFEPLRAACSGVSRIFVSPDRNLNLIPFEILMQPSGRYVTEDFEISYLSSSRDLLKTRPIKPETANSAVLVISPDFDAIPARDSSPQLAQILSEPTVSVTRGLSENAECLAVPFDPLPAALDEGVAISGLLQRSGEFRLLQFIGAEASEDALKNLTFPPTVLHLTSHGFSCPQTNASPEKPEASPLLYSGLALAGANRAIYGEEVTGEDGILTAFEASALNLIGTELVVLSACRSGTGTIWSREGVFGLRRAFRHAGARCLIMSLFDVDDETTATLMRQFYNFWLSGGSVSSALRRARLSLITERRRSAGAAHPIYWGGFVLAGNPN